MNQSNAHICPQVLKLGLVGSGISYSKSPSLHNAWMEQYGIKGKYNLIDCPVFDLLKAQQLIDEGYTGVNVTIPHKVSAFRLSDSQDDIVQEIGGANCLSFKDGIIQATNTDALALYEYLKPHQGIKKAVVIGTGATAKTTAWVLKKIGCDHIIYLSRSKYDHQTFPLIDLPKYVSSECDILINASPWGMNDEQRGINVSSADLSRIKCVVDWVYTPIQTCLIRASHECGVNIVDGMSLLVKQAKLSWAFWGLPYP